MSVNSHKSNYQFRENVELNKLHHLITNNFQHKSIVMHCNAGKWQRRWIWLFLILYNLKASRLKYSTVRARNISIYCLWNCYVRLICDSAVVERVVNKLSPYLIYRLQKPMTACRKLLFIFEKGKFLKQVDFNTRCRPSKSTLSFFMKSSSDTAISRAF